MLLESEEQFGYHSTGRSGALFSEIYANEVVRALSRASRAFLTTPPEWVRQTTLLSARGSLVVATNDQLPQLRELAASPDVARVARVITPREVQALVPIVRDDYAAAGLHDAGSCEIDVHNLLHGYLRVFHSRGGQSRRAWLYVAGRYSFA